MTVNAKLMLANSCKTALVLPAMLKPCVADSILPQVPHLNKIVLLNCDHDFLLLNGRLHLKKGQGCLSEILKRTPKIYQDPVFGCGIKFFHP